MSWAVIRYAVASTTDAAFKQVSHTKFTPNLAHVDRPTLVLETGVAGDNKQLGESRQLRDDVVHDAIDQIPLLGIGAQVRKRQHGNGGFVRKRRCWSRRLLGFGRRGVFQSDAVDVHGTVNILELVSTNILERDAEPAETALRVFLHSARHADTTGFCQCLQPGCHVYSIAVYAGTLNDIPYVD